MNKVNYEENWPESWKYDNRKKHTFNYIKSVQPDGGKILGVAAVQGNLSILLAELGYETSWNDIREDLVDYVKLKGNPENLSFLGGNIFDVNFPYLFDICLATEILEHVAHPDEFLINLSKLVEKNGHSIIKTPLGSYFKNKLPKFTDPSIFEYRQFELNSDDHIFLFHLDEIHMIAEMAGLEIVNMQYFTNFRTNENIKLNKLLKYISKNLVFRIDEFTQSMPHFITKRIHTSFVCL